MWARRQVQAAVPKALIVKQLMVLMLLEPFRYVRAAVVFTGLSPG